MADEQKAPSTTSLTGKSFGQMDGAEKVKWIGKVIVMLVTGGFAFPNVFVE